MMLNTRNLNCQLVHLTDVALIQLAQGQLDMEGALTARDWVGIQDFVLLDETTEVAFLSNLKKRFSRDLIYVSLGKDFLNSAVNKCMLHNTIFLPHCFRLTLAHYQCLSIPTKSWTSTIRNRWNSTWVSTFLSFHHTCECIIYMKTAYVMCMSVSIYTSGLNIKAFLRTMFNSEVFLSLPVKYYYYSASLQLCLGRQRLPNHAD